MPKKTVQKVLKFRFLIFQSSVFCIENSFHLSPLESHLTFVYLRKFVKRVHDNILCKQGFVTLFLSSNLPILFVTQSISGRASWYKKQRNHVTCSTSKRHLCIYKINIILNTIFVLKLGSAINYKVVKNFHLLFFRKYCSTTVLFIINVHFAVLKIASEQF